MSLASAMNAAMSGLGVTARRAEIVSINIANSGVEGYARRSLTVVPTTNSPGVRATGVERQTEPALLTDLRLSRAETGSTALLSRQLLRLEGALGKVGSSDGVAGSVARLDAALIAAAAAPGSEAALAEVAESAAALARKFSRTSATIQTVRAEADNQIATDVNRLSEGLSRIAMLDRQVIAARASGKETASLLDQRQMQIDALSPIIALREVVRPDGAAMIVAADGTVLLDGSAVRLSFSPTATMSPDRTAPLPAVLLDGRSVPTGPDGPLSGGTLAAAIRLRDTLTPALQSGLDKLALEIASRLRSADTTLPTGAAGLLTDEGGAVADPARLAGLSARLERNAAVDTNSGGALWRVRSGLGATTPLPPGDSRLLNGLSAALSAPTLGVEALLGPLAQSRTRAEEQASFATARSSTLSQQMAQGGVNSDRELQDLMQIERAYAANARVLQAVDEMLEFLLAR